jgi:hypothetical protein
MARQQRNMEGDNERGAGANGKPRPGNRDVDPKRTNRWE